MEVGPDTVVKCLKEGNAILFGGNKRSSFASVIALLIQMKPEKGILDVKDYVSLLKTNTELYALLSVKTFWFRFLGFIVPSIPEDVSCLKLFGEMFKQSNHPDWKRSLLSSSVVEQLDEPNKLHRLKVCSSALSSLEFWMAEFKSLILLDLYPTTIQANQIRETMLLVEKRGGKVEDMLRLIRDEDINQVLSSVAIHQFVTHPKFKGKCKWGDFYQVISPVCILQIFGLFHDVTVDLLKNPKWTFKKNVKLPAVLVNAIGHSLCEMTWLNYSDILSKEGLFKQIFRSVHMGAILREGLVKAINNNKNKNKKSSLQPQSKKKDLKKSDQSQIIEFSAKCGWNAGDVVGLEKAILMLACLRGKKYPADKEVFDKEWKKEILIPMKRLVEGNILFDKDQQWLNSEWDETLVGKRLNPPRNRSLAGILAQDGNTNDTWDLIFSLGFLSFPQLLMNLRSLILLNYPLNNLIKLAEKTQDKDLKKNVQIQTVSWICF